MQFDINKSIEILSQTPSTLKSLLFDLSEEWTTVNEGESTWSAFDVIGHLIQGEKTDWIPRAKIILGDSSNKTFKPFDRFAQFENSKGKSLKSLLGEFTELRKANLITLKSLNISEDSLNLHGIHPDFGPVSLKQLLATWVTHDLNHIAQISRVMARQYKSEVGPWLAYISILR